MDHDNLLAASDREAQRARFDLGRLALTGPPVRLRDLCELTGFSKMKFLADIESGKLVVRRVQTGTQHVVLVDRDEARRYLAAIAFAA